MRETIVKSLDASYGVALEMQKAGNRSVLDTQNEANMLAQAKVELANAQVRVLEERERLNVLLGAWGDNTNWNIETRLPSLPTEEVLLSGLESHAMTHRLDLLALKNDLERFAAEVGIARYQAIIPELTITGHFEREPDGTNSKGPSFVFPLPIFNWGEAASAQGKALLEQQIRRIEAQAIDIRSKIRVAYGRMKAARARAEYYQKELLPLQRKTVEQTQLFYNGMFFGVFQLLQAKQAQISAGQSYIETLKDYWLERTELERLIGGSFDGLTVKLEPSLSVVQRTTDDTSLKNGHQYHHGD
jgi:outer membrane protein, heavy metal efflux system